MKAFSNYIRYCLLGLIVLSDLGLKPLNAQHFSNAPIGHWRDHLSYYKTQKLAEVEDKILVAAGSAMFFYDRKTNALERFSKVNGLTDAGIRTLAYDEETKTIIVGYENSNIDIIHDDRVYNIPDIKIRPIEGSKEINSISFYNKKAYLSCGFGIVVIDLLRREIYDTYYIGYNSAKININNVVIHNDSLFAASSQGLLKAPYNSNSLASSDTWTRENIGKIKDSTEIDYLFEFNNKLVIGKNIDNDEVELYQKENNTWDKLFSNRVIYWIKPYNDYLVYKTWIHPGQGIVIMDKDLNEIKRFDVTWNKLYNYYDDYSEMKMEFGDVIINDKDIWFSNEKEGGIIIVNDYMNDYNVALPTFPNGPLSNDVYSIKAGGDGMVYVSPGGRNIQNAPRGISANLFYFDGNYWSGIQDYKEYGDLRDVLNITIHPTDPKKIMAASWWNGVLEIRDKKFVNLYNNETTNGVLKESYGYRIAGVEYDASGNLIIANSLSNTGLCYYTYRGVWGGFDTYSYIGNDEILGLMLDRFNHGNYYKFIWTKDNHILAFDNNGRTIHIDPNNGSRDRSNAVNCMVQDHDGEIWIGTDKGIKVIYSLDNLYEADINGNSKVTCNNIIYQDKGIAQYLLNFDNINTIMVDGGNRKWIGTERNGIFVYSPNGDKELYHFTAENSPLISNRVIAIAQQPISGEVFIGTDRGVVSYKAESTKGREEAGKLTPYPNPVKPDYTGIIAIKGFVKDSDVRITDINGNSVAHLKSIGGQAIWDGKDFNGRRVGSGVYLIFGSALEGKENSSGKILFVN